jgi:hypothetical protein
VKIDFIVPSRTAQRHHDAPRGLTTVPLLAQNNLTQEFSDRFDKIVVE